MNEMDFNTRKRQIERLGNLSTMADMFRQQVRGLHWNAWNGYGKATRVDDLRALQHDALVMAQLAQRLLETEETGVEPVAHGTITKPHGQDVS